MNITAGWWILPTIITIAAFFQAGREASAARKVGMRGADVVAVYAVAGATILSLGAWLIWSLL